MREGAIVCWLLEGLIMLAGGVFFSWGGSFVAGGLLVPGWGSIVVGGAIVAGYRKSILLLFLLSLTNSIQIP